MPPLDWVFLGETPGAWAIAAEAQVVPTRLKVKVFPIKAEWVRVLAVRLPLIAKRIIPVRAQYAAGAGGAVHNTAPPIMQVPILPVGGAARAACCAGAVFTAD